MPVHQGSAHLRRVLEALSDSDLARDDWELIVVDDASTDDSAEIAAGHADLVVRLTGRPRGPAYARNRGFDVARGSLVAFVDADVLVHRGALKRMVEAVDRDPTLGAVIGAFDASRASKRLVSDYRNLLRHVEHHANAGETDAFSAGLALIRRQAFAQAGMFDEWRFPRPQAEALELGDRMRALGYRIERRLDVRATHLKCWTVIDWIRVDLFDRGVSVARLSQFPDLRARAERLYLASPLDAVLAFGGVAGLVSGIWLQSALAVVLAVAAIAALVIHNRSLFVELIRVRGIGFAVASVPLHVITCVTYGLASAVGRAVFHAVGEKQPDAVVQAYAEVGVRTWPPVPTPRPHAYPAPVQGSTPAAATDRAAQVQ